MKKRLLSAIMTIALAISLFVIYVPSAKAATFGPYDYGNIRWTVEVAADGSSGVLTISRVPGVAAYVPIPDHSSGYRPPWYVHNAQVTQIVIDSGITDIGNWAFTDFNKLKYVFIQGSPARIGNDAFRGCGNLESFFVDNIGWAAQTFGSLTTIGDNAFYGCARLERLDIRNITSIGANVFVGCRNLSWIDAGDTGIIRSIGGGRGFVVGMSDNTGSAVPVRIIKSSVEPSSGALIPSDVTTITTIDAEAFAYLRSPTVTEVTLPASVTTIGDLAFAYIPGLKTATFLGDAPTYFGSGVFNGAHSDFKIVFFPHAQRWTTPTWQGYRSEVNNSLLTLDKYVIVLEKGSSTELRAFVQPSTATQSVMWKSNPTGIVDVVRSSNNETVGFVTGLTAGVTTVTAQAQGSGATAECLVIVLEKGVSATSIILDKALLSVAMNLAPDDYPTLTAIIQNSTGAPELVWSSSNPGVAYTNTATAGSLTREVIPVSPGQTIITVSTPDGQSRASCLVTVTAAPSFIPVTNITLNTSSVSMGAVVDLITGVQPSNATNSIITLQYLESLSSVKGASISGGSILNVPWAQTGTIVIEATVENGVADPDWGYSSQLDYTQQFTIYVVSFLPVTGITDVPNIAYTGRPLQLTGTVNPPGAAYRTIEWSLGARNTAAAYLDTTTGILVAQQPGEISVIATVQNGILNAGSLEPFIQTFMIYAYPYTAHALTLRADPGGSVSGAGNGQFAEGEMITITATPYQGYAFAGWYTTNGGNFVDTTRATTQFTMPGNATIVTAYFTYTGLPPGYTSGSGGGVVLPTPSHYFTYGTIYTRGSGVNFAHVTIRDSQLFSYVVLDGRTLVRNQQYFTGTSGGYTEITLVNGYLDTLNQGPHTLEIHFSDRVSVSAVFTVYTTQQVSLTYDDVFTSNWYYADVVYVSDRGWMTSTSSEPRQFRPSSPVTQGEVIDALYRMAGSPTILNQTGFALQGRDAAYEWVKAYGIMPLGGYYNLDSAISRQDFVVILARLVNVMNLRYTYIRSAITFNDEWQIDAAARTGVTNLYRAGIISGRTQSTFVPLGNMTRAECAAILHRFDEALR